MNSQAGRFDGRVVPSDLTNAAKTVAIPGGTGTRERNECDEPAFRDGWRNW